MILLFTLQLLLDMALIAALAWWWLDRVNRTKDRVSSEQMNDSVNQWEMRLRGFEEELADYRAKMQAQLAVLTKMGEEAKEILIRGRHRITAFPPSSEEEELRLIAGSAVTISSEDLAHSKIPTLSEVERTRERLRSDLTVDLKTLLKDQLA